MKIAVVAPVWVRVPPEQYGGIEVVVHLTVEEQVRQGKDITLFATGDAITHAPLRYIYPQAVGFSSGHQSFPETHVAWAFSQAGEFDLIHNHAGVAGISMARLIDKPVVTTLHNNYFVPENPVFFEQNKDNQFFVPISDAQKREIPGLNFTRTVYNAIEVDKYPFSEQKEDFLLSLGNLWEVKGHDTAIAVAKKLGMKLIIAGKLDPKGEEFFHSKVEPQVDGKQIFFEGQITQERKMELFSKARAFLFPIRWEEPFGLVMAEAMACGTPVIAFRHGSVPEVVVDGRTGFIVDTADEMAAAVGKVGQISARECRDHVERAFSPQRMADGYWDAYAEVLQRSKG